MSKMTHEYRPYLMRMCPACFEFMHKKYHYCGKESCREKVLKVRRRPDAMGKERGE